MMMSNAILSKSVRAACCVAVLGGSVAMAQSLAPAGGSNVAAAAQNASGKAPNIKMLSRAHDFGVITDEHNVTTSFEFVNDGDAPLVISNVRGGCGCTVPQLDKDVYEPGESGVVTVMFNPNKKKGTTRQKVTITSNDPDEPRAQVEITADVKQLVAVSPPNVSLGKVFRGEDNSAAITVTGMKEDFRIVEARVVGVGGEHWDVKIGAFEPIETSDGVYQRGNVTVSVKDDAPLGPLRGTLIMRTNDERKGSLSMTVAGRLAGDVTAMPERLSFGSMAGGQEYKKRIELRSRANAEFAVKSVTFDGNKDIDLATDIKPGANGGWVVTVTLAAPEQTGIVRGDLVIATTLDSEPEIKIPMAGAIRR